MKYTASVAALSLLLLAGCQQHAPVLQQSAVSSVDMGGGQASLPAYAHWKTYHDVTMNVSIDYPSDEFFITPIPFKGMMQGSDIQSDDFIQFGTNKITIAGVRIGDNMAEGQGTQLYRTKDAQILKYLQQYKPFTKDVTVHGVTFHQYVFEGMGEPYGYVTKKNGWYYVFDASSWPDVSQRMLQSLVFGK